MANTVVACTSNMGTAPQLGCTIQGLRSVCYPKLWVYAGTMVGYLQYSDLLVTLVTTYLVLFVTCSLLYDSHLLYLLGNCDTLEHTYGNKPPFVLLCDIRACVTFNHCMVVA